MIAPASHASQTSPDSGAAVGATIVSRCGARAGWGEQARLRTSPDGTPIQRLITRAAADLRGWRP